MSKDPEQMIHRQKNRLQRDPSKQIAWKIVAPAPTEQVVQAPRDSRDLSYVASMQGIPASAIEQTAEALAREVMPVPGYVATKPVVPEQAGRHARRIRNRNREIASRPHPLPHTSQYFQRTRQVFEHMP
ncbi:MAG: hypothetical protein L6R28_00115 [Planctomycetes bacterium]|nr:hypothetical protein [Planctomycetota bacterium]